MDADVTWLDPRPIIVTTFHAESDAQAVADAYRRALDLARQVEGNVFWIVDVRATDDAFVEVADCWLEIAAGSSDTTITPMPRGAFVGLTAMSEYFDEVQVPFFSAVDDALSLTYLSSRPNARRA